MPRVPKDKIPLLHQRIRENFSDTGCRPIAEEFNITLVRVCQIARELGVPATNCHKNHGKENARRNLEKYWPPEKLELLRARYPRDGAYLLMDELGLTYKQIVGQAQRMGLKCIDPYECRSRLKTNVDVEYFNKPWCPELAYVVGYIFADGCNQTVGTRGTAKNVRFHCVHSDDYLLREIRDLMKSKHSIATRKPDKNPNSQLATEWNVSNSYVGKTLEDRFGVTHRKSFFNIPFPNLEPGYENHFVRGFFDGDGTITVGPVGEVKFALYGTYQMLQGIQEFITRGAGVEPHAISTRHDSPLLHETAWQSRSELHKIYGWLYPDLDPQDPYLFLTRKMYHFQELLGYT